MVDLFNNGDPIKVLEVLKAAWAYEDLRFIFVDMEVEIFQWLDCTDDFLGLFFGLDPNNNVIGEAEDLILV